MDVDVIVDRVLAGLATLGSTAVDVAKPIVDAWAEIASKHGADEANRILRETTAELGRVLSGK